MACPEAPRHGRGHPEPTSAPRAGLEQPEPKQPDPSASSALPVHPCTQPALLPPHGHRHRLQLLVITQCHPAVPSVQEVS